MRKDDKSASRGDGEVRTRADSRPLGIKNKLKSNALDQLGHVTDAKYALHNRYTCRSCEFPAAHSVTDGRSEQ